MKSLRNFWLKHKIICNFISKTLLDKVETAKNKFLSTSYKERSMGHFDVEEVTKSTSYGALVLEANECLKMSERLITADTHMRLGSGDPRLQKERQTRLVEPPGGLHGDEDVLQL